MEEKIDDWFVISCQPITDSNTIHSLNDIKLKAHIFISFRYLLRNPSLISH